MSEHSDPAPVVGIKSGDRKDLKSVARSQKVILVCILIYLVALIGQFAIPPDVRPILLLIVVPVLIVATVFVFLLAVQVYHPAVGVLLGVLTLIPCVGLIVLLIINGQATGILRKNGIEVGMLGADLSRIQ